MKRILLIIPLVLLSACAGIQETPPPNLLAVSDTSAPEPTFTPVSSTTPTPVSSTTPTPVSSTTPTPVSSTTPTPKPYILEEGILLDWDEENGDYIVIAEGIETISTTSGGVIVALDNEGFPRFAYGSYVWVEIMKPDGAENYLEYVVPDRYVTIENEGEKSEELLETGTKVLVNPETGRYDYELLNGLWEVYEPRVMVVGEKPYNGSNRQIPKEVIETSASTVQNAILFKRVVDENIVEIRTGLDDFWNIAETTKDFSFLQWYGVLCGSVELNKDVVIAFIGVEMNSGDILLINISFYRPPSDIDLNVAGSVRVILEGVISPKYEEYEETISDLRIWIEDENEDNELMLAPVGQTMEQLGKSVTQAQIANAILKTPAGTPFFLVSNIGGDTRPGIEEEKKQVWDALKSREFFGSSGSSYWISLFLGATEEFWEFTQDY